MVAFFLRGSLDLHVSLHDIHAYSAFKDKNLAMLPHLQKMVIGPLTIPLFIKEIQLHDAYYTLDDRDHACSHTVHWHSMSKKIGRILKTTLHIIDGAGKSDTDYWYHHLTGSLNLDCTESVQQAPALDVTTKVSVQVPHLLGTPLSCYAQGQWHTDNGHLTITTSDPDCALDQCTITNEKEHYALHVQARLSLQYMQHFMPTYSLPTMQGVAHIAAHTLLPDIFSAWHATITAHDCALNGFPLGTPTATLRHANATTAITGSVALPLIGNVTFSGTAPDSGACTMNIDTNHAYTLCNGVTLVPQKKAVQCTYDTTQGLQGTITLPLHIHDMPFPLQGIFSCKEHITLEGTIDLALLSTSLQTLCNLTMMGQGKAQVTLWHDARGIHWSLTTEQATIPVPHIYNHIQALSCIGCYNPLTHSISLDTSRASLYKGTIDIGPATVHLGPHHAPHYWHIPLLLNGCLITLQKGVFAVISGSLISTKQNNDPLPWIRGHLIIDRAQLQEQIFSLSWLQELFSLSPTAASFPDCGCDITLETKEPITLKTDFLNTKVQLHMHITGTIANPQVRGTIQLQGGTLQLPYKPLYITKGTLQFQSPNLDDPIIEIAAKNVIKKHHIMVQVTGTLQHPQMVLTSTPPLTEDHIISLLLAGTHEESLNTALSTFIIESLKNLIVHAPQSSTSVVDNVKRMLNPLKKVHVIPRFADQTVRGGLKAALEIDVTDRLSVLLQKNFSLTEDTRLELEYLLSDDISLRGVRDERKDVTGEVEMKWKF